MFVGICRSESSGFNLEGFFIGLLHVLTVSLWVF